MRWQVSNGKKDNELLSVILAWSCKMKINKPVIYLGGEEDNSCLTAAMSNRDTVFF